MNSCNEQKRFNCDELESQLVTQYGKYIRMMNLRDIEAIVAYYHRDAIARVSAHESLVKSFDTYTTRYTICSHVALAFDGEFAFSRVVQEVETIAGPNRPDFRSDVLVAWKLQDDVWCLWDVYRLRLQLNEPR